MYILKRQGGQKSYVGRALEKNGAGWVERERRKGQEIKNREEEESGKKEQ